MNEKTAGAFITTLLPSEGTAASILEEKEHLSSRPSSEPTMKVSGSHGDKAKEVTPTLLLLQAYGMTVFYLFFIDLFTNTGPHRISLKLNCLLFGAFFTITLVLQELKEHTVFK